MTIAKGPAQQTAACTPGAGQGANPLAVCRAGHDAAGTGLPPRCLRAANRHRRAIAPSPALGLALPGGGAAERRSLTSRAGAGATGAAWRTPATGVVPLPRSTWRSPGWLARCRPVAAGLVPALHRAVPAKAEKA
jgi:hypothetical protein